MKIRNEGGVLGKCQLRAESALDRQPQFGNNRERLSNELLHVRDCPLPADVVLS